MSDKDERDEGQDRAAADASEADAKAEERSKEDEPAKADEEKKAPDSSEERPSVEPPVVEAAAPPEQRKAAAWGRPLMRLDAAWTKWEVALCAVTIVSEILVLSLWVCLKGLSTAADGSSKAGLVFRALGGAIVLGAIAWWSLKKQSRGVRRIATVTASIAGLLLAKTWGNAGVDWASNMLNWFQQASFLTLLGGLRGVGTRLTLLLALLGGSLATAAGKHITIDLLTRYLKKKQRLPVIIAGWLAASFICATAAWGFFDHIAIDDFDAKPEMTPGEKLSTVTHQMGEHFFVSRKQLALDVKSLPHVIKGERYSEYMGAEEWNSWVKEAGFAEHYGAEKAKLLEISADMKKSPIVVVPEKGEPRAELTKAANLVFPIGLAVIAFRFILLCLLALSGHRSVDVEGHGDLAVVPGGKTDKHAPEPAKEEAR